ncbi:uncharacterized protein LOC106639273 [Copidosoma floridanum]|uniref:uncharacterized protein LOC106639273 n=1 Tax=Copidosoma floridanum TaxID=29053 RepID=UPI0006C99317|nr:uncharacterized protein LOC106639273 [Copidosoma floridanum]
MSSTSTASGKGTRKTYSFEEREILVNLIAKHLHNGHENNTEDDCARSSNGSTEGVSRRKSLWSQLTEEYNSLVGSENSRSSIQLRRCWENMKANKRNRDADKRCPFFTASQDLTMQLPPASTLGLPPNVVFQPKESEPFAFEGLMVPTFRCTEVKKEPYDFHEDGVDDKQEGNDELVDDPGLEPASKRQKTRKTSSPSSPKKLQPTCRQSKVTPKPCIKTQKSNDMYEYAISEAQLKLETAALLKEEARLKLEEAEYRKEEARMRMICVTYELQKLRDECNDAKIEDGAF